MADYSDLKNKFKTDDIPTGDNYAELIDLAGSAKDLGDNAVVDNKDGSITINGTKLVPVNDNKDGTIRVNGSSYRPVIDNNNNTLTLNGKVIAPVKDNQDGTITVNTQTYTPVKKSDYTSDLDNLVTKKQVSIPNSSLMDIGEFPDSMREGVNKLVSSIDSSKFNMLWISDSHYENLFDSTVAGAYPYGGMYGLNHAAVAEYLSNYVDVVVAGGDNTNGIDASLQHSISDLYSYATRLIVSSSESDKFLLLGNHDDGSPIAAQGVTVSPDMVMTNEDFEKAFMTGDLNFGETRDNGGLYFYKDYPDKKVRVIGLNSLDIPYDMKNSDGSSKYTRWLDYAYNNEQLNWLVNSALMVPQGYGVIICTHIPLTYGFTPSSKSSYHNFDMFEEILNCFVTGQSKTIESKSGTPPEFATTVNTKFGNQGPRSIIGLYGGHVHVEFLTKLTNFTQVISLADVNVSVNNIGTINELGMSVIQVDTQNRQVDILGLGRATNRSYKY